MCTMNVNSDSTWWFDIRRRSVCNKNWSVMLVSLCMCVCVCVYVCVYEREEEKGLGGGGGVREIERERMYMYIEEMRNTHRQMLKLMHPLALPTATPLPTCHVVRSGRPPHEGAALARTSSSSLRCPSTCPSTWTVQPTQSPPHAWLWLSPAKQT